MKNIKNKLLNNRAALLASATATVAMASQALCLSDKLNNIVNMIWMLCTFAGIVMVAIGLVQLVRCIIALTGGDQLQPGQLGKAIGLVAAGLAAAVLKTVLGLIGVPTQVSGF